MDKRNKAYMLCGYKRTGKDTFFNDFVNMNTEDLNNKWVVYSSTSSILEIPHRRIAFADKLKIEVARRLGVDHSAMEELKDRVLVQGKTFRSHLIDAASKVKEEDPYYWVRTAIRGVQGSFIVTDWRFVDEYNYLSSMYDVSTIRIFRKEVEIPTHPTETNLDNFTTEYLVVPALKHEDHFKYACEVFPQYRDHTSGF